MKPSHARTVGLIWISIGAHMTAFGGLAFVPAPEEVAPPSITEFEVLEPEPEPPPEPPEPPEPPPEPEPVPAPKPRPRPKPRKPKAPPEPEPQEAPPPVAEAPVDFTGVTLTAAAGVGGWKTVVGNGKQFAAPPGRIGKVTGRDRAGSANGKLGGTGRVPSAPITKANLSRSPAPPNRDMNQLLVRNYPPRAKAQGIEGVGVLRVRILASGQVRILRTKKETGQNGFALACKTVLRAGGPWSPAIDRTGKRGSYDIDYTCRFEVNL